MPNPEPPKGLRRGDVKDSDSASSLSSSTILSRKNGHTSDVPPVSSSGEESQTYFVQASQKTSGDCIDKNKQRSELSSASEGDEQMTKEVNVKPNGSEKIPRGGSSGVSEEGLNISDLECVWGSVNGIVDLPNSVALASVETLSTTSSNTPRSFTTSSHQLPLFANSQSHTPSASNTVTASVPQPDLNTPNVGVDGVKRSLSLADTSALSSNASKRKGYPYHHQKSPSYGSVPKDTCPINSRHERAIDIQVRPSQIGVAFRSHSLQEGQQETGKVLSTSISSPSEDLREHDLEDESVHHSEKRSCSFSSGIGEPSVYHALIVIFLEFFAWGLLTSPMIIVLKTTFPDHTFLMNGIIMGIKGLLSFLSAPLIGALSDTWGRKFFLFITVFFTCLPIPFMKINTWWYFALISMSGVFAVTYSIVFAYVADVTDPAERHHAYGLVSASFAASLVTSPALGAYLSQVHSDDLVVGLATAIAVLDIFFILVAVPESLPEKLRISSTSTTWSTQISWEQADPFSTLWKVSKDKNILLISVTVFLSYLPEAGQLSCFFVYLQLVMGFGPEMVATFIAVVGIMSVVAQTALLGLLIRTLSNKRVISVGLVFELLQLMWYGFGSQTWMMWAAGILAAISSITYPAISAYISTHTDIDKQGVVQGIVTGMRGLCSGLGPAVFGFIFYLFHVDLNQSSEQNNNSLPGGGVGVGGAGIGGGNGSNNNNNSSLTQGHHIPQISPQVPGPPFVFGAMLVLLALTVSAFIPEGSAPKNRKQSASALDLGYSRDHKKSDSLDGTSQPLMNESGVL